MDYPDQYDMLAMEREERIWPRFSAVPRIHFCPDFDFMLVWEGNPEYECCTCYKSAFIRESEVA